MFESISTGRLEVEDGGETGRASEVIDISNPNLSCDDLADALTPRGGAVGGLLDGRPMICAGKGFNNNEMETWYQHKNCFFVQGKIDQRISMTEIRSGAASVILKGINNK